MRRDAWPFLGRDDDVRRLRCSLDAGGAVVAGRSGVGKTRLVDECVDRPALRLTGSGAPIPDLGERLRGQRLVVVDDAHRIDDRSAAVLLAAARSGDCAVLAVVDSGESAPVAITTLWKDDVLDRIDLHPVDDDTLHRILCRAVGGWVDDGTARELVGASGGHLALLRELTEGAVESGALRDDDGIWRLTEFPSPSPRLVALVESQLTGADRELLEIVALGEPLGSELLHDLTDLTAAARLESRGLLASTRTGSRVEVRFTIPVHGQVLRARMGELRVVAVSERLARAADTREDIVQVARWRLESGLATADLVLEAAVTARWRYDFALAERLATAAAALGAGFEADLLLGRLACLRGRWDEGEPLLAALAERAVTDEQRALVATTRIDNAAFHQGDLDRARRIAREAERSVAPGAWHDEIRARHCGLLLATDGPAAAVEAAGPILERTRGRAKVWSCLAASCGYGRLGQHEAAISAADAGHAAHLELDRPLEWYPWIHRFFESEALAHAGFLRAAEELSAAQYAEGIAARSREAQAWFALSRATFVAELGDVVGAVLAAREAQVLFDGLGRPQFAQEARVYLATALALGGDGAGAADALASFHTEGPHPLFMAKVDQLLAEGWTAVASGRIPNAVTLFREAADTGTAIGDLVGAAAALHATARVGFPREVVDPLAGLAVRSDGVLIPARARHVAALAAADGPELSAVAAQFAGIGAHLLAGEAQCDATVAFRRAGDQARAAGSAARAAEQLARCRGARTPALRAVDDRSAITPAEMQVVLAAVAGASNREIADQIGRSVRTVENHLQRVYGKLGVSGRAGLIESFRRP